MTAINRIEFIDFEYEVTNLASHTEHTHNHVAYKKGAKMKMRKRLCPTRTKKKSMKRKTLITTTESCKSYWCARTPH